MDIGEFHKNDDVLRFMLYLIDEREKLTTAIGRAKASIGFDLDAAVETNKFRQTVARNINMMLRYRVGKRTERGTDYKRIPDLTACLRSLSGTATLGIAQAGMLDLSTGQAYYMQTAMREPAATPAPVQEAPKAAPKKAAKKKAAKPKTAKKAA